ncbi:hypothetical protein N5T63_04610 [Aliarcobacter cryaerophilus]|uniref:hypothetical protein n=1 Tax=Aliarcobacter cryaerophilus TaxID=28198 RepID=UPI0021B68311|nr:hypothetical protein [Aliarcobacter cryaerophilus]MCT7488191.1 hypothetical protein [Aliarcobacter cryaerophilus]
MKKILFLSLSLVATTLLFVGCGHIGNSIESDNSLSTKAAFALNTTSDKVQISNREASLDAINFVATTNGKTYQCYVTTVFGALTSDAVCSGANITIPKNENRPCNDLLKAAGRC